MTLTIAATGTAFFDDLPGQLTFSSVTGSSTTPPSQPVQVRDGGTGTLNWSVSSSTADGGGWLSVSQSSGTTPSTLTVGVVTSSLPGGGFTAGTYIGQLKFSSADGTVTVPVSFVIGANIFEQANPISFTKPFAARILCRRSYHSQHRDRYRVRCGREHCKRRRLVDRSHPADPGARHRRRSLSLQIRR